LTEGQGWLLSLLLPTFGWLFFNFDLEGRRPKVEEVEEEEIDRRSQLVTFGHSQPFTVNYTSLIFDQLPPPIIFNLWLITRRLLGVGS